MEICVRHFRLTFLAGDAFLARGELRKKSNKQNDVENRAGIFYTYGLQLTVSSAISYSESYSKSNIRYSTADRVAQITDFCVQIVNTEDVLSQFQQ
jgi:hypothetical protein